MNPIKKLALSGLAALALTACGNPEKPSMEEISKNDGFTSEYRIMDVNNDGVADALTYSTRQFRFNAAWYASDMKDQLKENGVRIFGSREMTQGIRDAATAILRSQHQLEFNIQDRLYNKSIKNQQK